MKKNSNVDAIAVLILVKMILNQMKFLFAIYIELKENAIG